MRIAFYGATGRVSPYILREALNRGHHVTAIVRDLARLTVKHEHLHSAIGDVLDAASVATLVEGYDVVVASIASTRDGNIDVFVKGARACLEGLPRAGVKRLLWVGGARSLEISPGVNLVDTVPRWQCPLQHMRSTNSSRRALPLWTGASPVPLPARNLGSAQVSSA